jgi:hypothetical protein
MLNFLAYVITIEFVLDHLTTFFNYICYMLSDTRRVVTNAVEGNLKEVICPF